MSGILSIEEIEVTDKSSRKAKETAGKKAGKKVARKTAASSAGGKAAKVDVGPVVLAKQAGIKTIGELKAALMRALSADSPAVVDAGSVESIDTAALQLLVAFANSMRNEARAVEWKEPSEAFREMADLADLTRHLRMGDESTTDDDDGLCPVF